jgi:hypothetical protein
VVAKTDLDVPGEVAQSVGIPTCNALVGVIPDASDAPTWPARVSEGANFPALCVLALRLA